MSETTNQTGFSLFSFQFPDLGQILYDNLVKPIVDFFSDVWNTIVSAFRTLGEGIYKGFLWIIDSVIGFFEYTLNSIRGYLPYAIAIALSWTIITRSWESEKLSLPKKILLTFSAPFVGAVIGKMLNTIIPPGVQLPRFSHVIQPEKIEGKFNHSQISYEYVKLADKYLTIKEDKFNHSQISYERVELVDKYLTVKEEVYHGQSKDEHVIITERLEIREDFYHTQYTYHYVTTS